VRPGSTLEGVGLILTYYLGSTQLTGAPSAVGTYTVIASFPGSTDYTSASATATFSITLTASGTTGAFVLSPTAAGALSVSGNAQLQMSGPVAVDSSSTSALSASGNARVSAASIRVVGRVSSGGNAQLSPSPVTGAGTFGDPLANLPVPSVSGSASSVSLSGSSTLTINPGIFNSISVSGSAQLTMNPGIYVIAGGGFSVTGNGSVVTGSGSSSVTGAGVLIYNAGSNYLGSGNTFGVVNLSGSGTINLKAPDAGTTYAGIVIFQSRDNTSTVALSGSGLAMTGVIYAPAAALTMSGSGVFKGSLVVNTLSLSGNAVAQLTAGSGGVVYSPSQVGTGYGINNLPFDGTGQTIAIVDAYDNPAIYQSVDAFDAQFALTSSGSTLDQLYGPASSFLTVLSQRGETTALPGVDPAGSGTDNWEVETALDVEWAHAVAPGAQIVLVEADSQSLADLMAAVKTAAALPGVSVVSMSWGFPEGLSVLAQDEATYDSYFTTPAGHQGVTFVASTGDYGAAVPLYPAMSRNVVAVGGTTLTLNADSSYKSEVAGALTPARWASSSARAADRASTKASRRTSRACSPRGAGRRRTCRCWPTRRRGRGSPTRTTCPRTTRGKWWAAPACRPRPGRACSPWSIRGASRPAGRRSGRPVPTRRRRRCTASTGPIITTLSAATTATVRGPATTWPPAWARRSPTSWSTTWWPTQAAPARRLWRRSRPPAWC
jgi:hypothetical protein